MTTSIINARKFDGSLHRSWKAELTAQTDSRLIFVGQFDQEVDHPRLGLLSAGTISYEYYWVKRWYNIFRFHEPDGRFRNYYCNISMPPTFSNGVLDYIDLDIDILVLPDASVQILDFEEFDVNGERYGYPPAVRTRALKTLAELEELIRMQRLPFEQKYLNPPTQRI